MIYFITNSDRHLVYETEELRILDKTQGRSELVKYLKRSKTVGIDVETTGLDPFINDTLLLSIGDEHTQFVLDLTSLPKLKYLSFIDKIEIEWIGHNLKFDYSMLFVNHNVQLGKLYDTMIAHQRLFQNSGLPSSLEYLCNAYLGIQLEKSTRVKFIGVNPNTHKFTNEEVIYSAVDIKYLLPLKARQVERIEKYNMSFLLYNIEFPLIKVLTEMELIGFNIDKKKWKELYETNKDEAFDLEVKMDNQVRTLRDNLLSKDPIRRAQLVAGQWDRERIRHPKLLQVDIFGEAAEVIPKVKENRGNISYNSPTQLVHIFAVLGLDLPNKGGFEYLSPLQNKRTGKYNYPQGSVTTGAKELEAYIIEHSDSPAIEFIKNIIKYKKHLKEVTTYGLNFLEKINSVTGKLHTIYRQCATDNARLSSGGGKKQPDRINIQNIPAKKDRRNCFVADKGYKIITCDLSGAEVTIMASKAQDFRLLELSGEDIHSHFATKAWRNIFLYRLGQELGLWLNAKEFFMSRNKFSYEYLKQLIDTPPLDIMTEYYDLLDKTQNFIVTKEKNNDKFRKPGKNVHFAITYGARPKRIAKTINISQDEGVIYRDAIRTEIPDTFRLMESNVRFVMKHGYLVLNERTNSRVWFQPVLRAKELGKELSYEELKEVDGPARNLPISGTQADMVKEAMVIIHNHFKANNIDAQLLMQVHDELVIHVHESIAEEIAEYVKNVMCNTANKYLNNIEMKAEYHILDYWTK